MAKAPREDISFWSLAILLKKYFAGQEYKLLKDVGENSLLCRQKKLKRLKKTMLLS